MKIENLKDLQKLIQLCRKEGIDAFEIGEIKFNLGQKPSTIRKFQSVANDFPEASLKVPTFNPTAANNATTQDLIKTDGLTDEQLLMWSVGNDSNTEQQG